MRHDTEDSLLGLTLRFLPSQSASQVNLGAVSDENGERFHQDISDMESGTRANGFRAC